MFLPENTFAIGLPANLSGNLEFRKTSNVKYLQVPRQDVDRDLLTDLYFCTTR